MSVKAGELSFRTHNHPFRTARPASRALGRGTAPLSWALDPLTSSPASSWAEPVADRGLLPHPPTVCLASRLRPQRGESPLT